MVNNNLYTILNRYYSILKNLGYIDYTGVLNIVLYLALEEIYSTLDDNKYKEFIKKVLHNIEKNICLVSTSIPCIDFNNSNCNEFIFGFLDVERPTCNNCKCNIIIKRNRSFSESFSNSFK